MPGVGAAVSLVVWLDDACPLVIALSPYTVVAFSTTQKTEYRTLGLPSLRVTVRNKRRKKMTRKDSTLY